MNDILRPPRHFRNVPRNGSDQPKAEWQATMRALLLVAEHDDPAMFARIDVIRALNSHFEPVFDPSRKDTRWGPRRLRIDDGSKQVWRDVSRSAAHLPAALPAAHSRELRPSALVADKPWHPRQAVPSLAQASSDIRGIHQRASRHHQYVWPLQAPLACSYDAEQTNCRQIPSSLRARFLGSPRT